MSGLTETLIVPTIAIVGTLAGGFFSLEATQTEAV